MRGGAESHRGGKQNWKANKMNGKAHVQNKQEITRRQIPNRIKTSPNQEDMTGLQTTTRIKVANSGYRDLKDQY